MTITINTKKYEPHVSNTLTEKQITTHGDIESGPALALPNAENEILRFQILPTFLIFFPPPLKPNCVKEFISSLRISNLDPKRLSIYYTRHSLNSLFFLFFPSSLFSTEVATSFSPFLRSFFILLITCSFSISLKNISFQTFVSCSRTNKILHQNPAYCPFFI